MSTQEEIDALGGGKTIRDWEARFEPPYFRCIGRDASSRWLAWWTPLRYAWDEFRTFNLCRL